MAVGIDVELMHEYYDETTNTSTVTATVVIDYTKGSYNGYSPSGTLVVNGQSYDFNSNFNYENGQQISQNGSVVAYTTTITVPHNDDGSKTVYASATFDTGISSGTVSTSNALTLPNGTGSGSGSGSGGGSTGGDSGDGDGSGSGSGGGGVIYNPEEDWWLGTGNAHPHPDYEPTYHKIYIDQGEHTTVIVACGGAKLNDGDSTTLGSAQVFYRVDDGYSIDIHTIDGKTFNNGDKISFSFYDTRIIQTRAKKNEERFHTNISNHSNHQIYECYLDNGTNWVPYTPYICVENIYERNGLFEATVNAPYSESNAYGVILRNKPNRDAVEVSNLPNGLKIGINSIAISEYGGEVWMNTTCKTYDGLCNGWLPAQYLDFVIYGIVNNEYGAYLYSDTSVDSAYYLNLDYGFELNISELKAVDELIWGRTLIKNADGYNISGYVKISDIGMKPERVLEWVPCVYKKKTYPVSYLFKNGTTYYPLVTVKDDYDRDILSGSGIGGAVQIENNMLKYYVNNRYYDEFRTYFATEEKFSAVKLYENKYICIWVGNLDADLYIGLKRANNVADKVSIHHAMHLTPDDSNKLFYADLSSLFLYGDYYFAFGTDGAQFYEDNLYIRGICLFNEIEEGMIYKPLNSVLKDEDRIG